ncbi:MAG: hypothetical protein V8S95_00610 [Odoribacter sp.]
MKGIYDTGFKEYDDMTVLCDIRHLQRLNGWDAGQLTGVAIELEDIRLIPAVKKPWIMSLPGMKIRIFIKSPLYKRLLRKFLTG